MVVEKLKSLKDLKEYPSAVYDGIDLNRLLVYAIALLGENAIPVTFENLVIGLHKMFPRRFGMQGFEEYPDAARVNRALLQLRPKYRNWARGSVRTGFTLTETGKAVLEQTRKLLVEGGAPAPLRKTPRPRTRDLLKDLQEIEGSSLFKAYSSGQVGSISPRMVYDLLNAFPYTPKKVLSQRLIHLIQVARQCEKVEIIQFLQWVEGSFREIFRERAHA